MFQLIKILAIIQLLIFMTIFTEYSLAKRTTIKCQNEQECQMKAEHFALYSLVKQNLNENFKHMHGKDLVPFVRAVEILKRRFELQTTQDERTLLNGTNSVLSLIHDKKLIETMEIFNSDEGRQLIELYKSSINSNEQNLACSQWRVQEIERAAHRLKQSARLSAVFANIHGHFVERSARKCLKTSCKAVADNMSHLDSVLRFKSRQQRRAQTIRRDIYLSASSNSRRREAAGVAAEFIGNELREETDGAQRAKSGSMKFQLENSDKIDDDDDKQHKQKQQQQQQHQQQQQRQQANGEDLLQNEFYEEELELCRFLKRTNSTSCQASGRELSAISFLRNNDSNEKQVALLANETMTVQSNANATKDNNSSLMGDSKLLEFLTDYERQLNSRLVSASDTVRASASQTILAKCATVKPLLEYNLYALRWYTRQQIVRFVDKFESRASWCPSLSYWLEIDRLCGELEVVLNREIANTSNKSTITFAY